MVTAEAPVQAGDVLAGKYRVERVLGVGGMGVVVAATHVDLGQRVALKFLLPQALLHPEAAPRFLREARAAVKIDSEHVARVIDVGRMENGAPYMVMEYLEGQDLSDHPKGRDLPIPDAIDFVLQACEAMAVAHTAGIIHRDLKPANLFVARRPDGAPIIKVLDFGISKVTEIEAGKVDLTQTSAVMGSPLYMSPEQMKSARRVDVRADIWSLGTILYELLAGVPPFNGETLGEVFAAVMMAEPPSLRQLRPEVSEQLERVVLRSLEKDPARRYANVGELTAALSGLAPDKSRILVERVSGILGRAGVTVSIPNSVPGRPAPVAAATNTSWEDAPVVPVTGPRRAVVIGVGALVVLLGVGAAVVISRGTSPAVSPDTAPRAAAVAAVPATPVVVPVAAVSAVAVAPASTGGADIAVLPAPAPPVAELPRPSVASPAPLVARSARRDVRAAPAPAAPVAPVAAVAAPAPAPVPAAAPREPAAKVAPPAAKKNPLSIDFK
jgi:serine/threonine-protein kinase